MATGAAAHERERPALVFKLPRVALLVVGAATFLRLIVAFRVPLNGDEAYYWTWSRHLALGYVDHPPAVAWLIALAAPLGHSPGAVRLPFVACEALTALALGRAALLLSGSPAAGAAAAIAFTLIPETKLAAGEARPDGPYLLCWALALWFAARAVRAPAPKRAMAALGLALGGAILSRFFGWVLLLGILAYGLAPEQRELRRGGLWIAFAIAVALYVPFIAWNATHGWVNFRFTVHDRQALGSFSAGRFSVLSTARFLVLAIPFAIVAYFTALRPRRSLISWTALPFPIVLTALAAFESVESYWLLGPFASLCAGIGMSLAGVAPGRRRLIGWIAALPALATTGAMLFLALPETAQADVFGRFPPARAPLSSASFMFAPLAADVRTLAATRSALVLSDAFELGAPLYYHGVPSVMTGSTVQAPMWNAWPDIRTLAQPAARWGLLVRFERLERDPGLAARFGRGCSSVRAGPVLRYAYAGVPEGTFHTYWCQRPIVSMLEDAPSDPSP
jgi:hypothetical protein